MAAILQKHGSNQGVVKRNVISKQHGAQVTRWIFAEIGENFRRKIALFTF